jgi:tripartite-type tricarboxylate transporter receptor subunit TctC
MEGGGGMRLANYLYNAANKEGATFGIFNRGIGFDQLLGSKSAQFDATKFSWVGSTNNEISVCVVWHTAGVTNWEQVRTQEVVVGASGPAADTFQFPKIANGVLGTKFKIISGYPGGNDIDIAMERGEVQGRCGWSWTAVKPNVPLIVDLATTDEDRAIFKMIFARQVMAWPFAAPPGVPKDRADALRKAFMDTMKDKDFLAEAAKGNLDINPVSGDEIQKLVVDIYSTPAAIVQKTSQHLQ